MKTLFTPECTIPKNLQTPQARYPTNPVKTLFTPECTYPYKPANPQSALSSKPCENTIYPWARYLHKSANPPWAHYPADPVNALFPPECAIPLNLQTPLTGVKKNWNPSQSSKFTCFIEQFYIISI